MFKTRDVIDSGWSKLCGVGFGYVHYNSFRFVYRIIDSKMIIGYYSYIRGVTPQENDDLKGSFKLDIKVGDVLKMDIHFSYTTFYSISKNNEMIRRSVAPLPSGWKWPVFECYPNIKDDAICDIDYIFL